MNKKGDKFEKKVKWARDRSSNGKSIGQDSFWDKKDKICPWDYKKGEKSKKII